jgi:hypothetical protein
MGTTGGLPFFPLLVGRHKPRGPHFVILEASAQQRKRRKSGADAPEGEQEDFGESPMLLSTSGSGAYGFDDFIPNMDPTMDLLASPMPPPASGDLEEEISSWDPSLALPSSTSVASQAIAHNSVACSQLFDMQRQIVGQLVEVARVQREMPVPPPPEVEAYLSSALASLQQAVAHVRQEARAVLTREVSFDDSRFSILVWFLMLLPIGLVAR